MEAVNRQFKAKGIFEVSFAQPGVELMLNGGGMYAGECAGSVSTAEPAGERTAEQVALIVTTPPVATWLQGNIDHHINFRQGAGSPCL